MKNYYTIKDVAKSRFKEKSSEFIAFIHPVTDVSQVKKILQEYKRKFPDARHICYAYKIGNNEAFSDAGEPKFSSGPPILYEIKKAGLTHALVLVIRYFGGIKLGIRGLKNAYGKAASMVIQNAEIVPFVPKKQMKIQVQYDKLNLFFRKLNAINGKIIQQNAWEKGMEFLCEIPEDFNFEL